MNTTESRTDPFLYSFLWQRCATRTPRKKLGRSTKHALDYLLAILCFGSGQALTLCWASGVLESTGLAAPVVGQHVSCCEPGRTSGYSDDEAYQRVASPLNGGSVYVNSVCMSQLPQPIPFQQPNAFRPLSNTDCSCMFL